MIGVYYYPEQWPEIQWKRDIKNIKSHGMRHIHLAEFSWSQLEPREGIFDFSWLDRAIDLAAAEGLGVILCTPTATPPVWMSKKYPEILMVKENLARVTHGSRAHRCVNSQKFQQFSKRIITELGKRYGTNPSVIGWQLDNEIGHYENSGCFCESCHAAFIVSMEKKYTTVKELNRHWAGDFWSQNYDSFDQIELPNPFALPYLPNEHCLLDFKTFFSRSLSRFLDQQSKTLREYIDPRMWITHNFMKDYPAHNPGHVAKDSLDLYSLTIYPVAGHYLGESGRELHRLGDPYNISLNHEQMRSYNGHWGVMEQQPGQVNWGPCNLRPYPGAVRLWLWTAVAHGAELLDTYRYRQPLVGAEQYHEGITDLGGVALSQGGKEFVQTAQELRQFAALLNEKNVPKRQQERVAFIVDWSSLTALSLHPQSENFHPMQCVTHFYRALKKNGLRVDFLPPQQAQEFKNYDLVCVVLVDLVENSFIQILEEYVTSGGHLLLSPRNFTRLANGHFPEERYGRRFEKLTGATFQGYDVMSDEHNGRVELLDRGEVVKTVQWRSWAEQIVAPAGSDILAVHGDQFYRGSTAAFSMSKGNGRISYIGFDEKNGIDFLMEKILAYHVSRKKSHKPPLLENTIYMQRGNLSIFLNYNDRQVTVPDNILAGKKILLGSKTTPPAGVVLLQ